MQKTGHLHLLPIHIFSVGHVSEHDENINCQPIMKKQIVVTILFLMAAVMANAQFIFRISGNGLEKPSYILGTLHTLPGSMLDTIPEYVEAEAQCRQLYAEFNISDQQQMDSLKTAGQQATALPDGKTIFDVLSQEQTDLLNTKFNEVFHVNLTDSVMMPTWNYQPTVFLLTFTMIITTEEMRKYPEMGLTGTPIDVTCLTRAKERGMEIGQLDEIQSKDSLTKIRNTLNASIDVQIDSLMSFLNHFEQRKQALADETHNVAQSAVQWKSGDYDSFAGSTFWLKEINNAPKVYKQRNEKWLPKIKTAMNEAPTMFVFGAGHLIGANGVIEMLRNAGYEVVQVKKNTRPVAH